jgi:hypothetical protein
MVTSAQRHEQANQFIDTPDVTLIEFWEDGSSQIERAALNNETITHLGNQYLPLDFGINLPSSNSAFQEVGATIPNASKIPGLAVLNARKRIQCRMIHVDGLDHDVIIWDTSDMLVFYNVKVDVLTVSGSLGAKPDGTMPYPFTYTGKKTFPGLWFK